MHINFSGMSLSGKYKLSEKIGSGGMGTVFKAHQTSLNRLVAIKILHPHFSSDESFLKRFNNEALFNARLEHPNIIRIYEFEKDNDIHYMVMEYIEGADLRHLIEEKKFYSPKEAILIVKQIAQALAYAHQHKIIHRDIKPGNILVSNTGTIKVGDFGVAGAMDEISMTLTGQVLGTPKYMPPEQARGESIDQKMDIYSLGMVMLKLLTGKTPYDGIPSSRIRRRLEDPKDIPQLEFSKEIDGEIKKIVQKLIAKDTKLRYAKAQEVIEDIDRYLNKKSSDSPVFKKNVKDLMGDFEYEEIGASTVLLDKPIEKSKTKTNYKIISICALAALVLLFGGYRFFRRTPEKVDNKPAIDIPVLTVTPQRQTIKQTNKINTNNNLPVMVLIPGGCFMMGNQDATKEEDELPAHEVCVDDFYLGETEITFDQFNTFCDETGRKKPKDKGWGAGQMPVINVSWYDAKEYTEWLSKKTGAAYTLPTEAQWEYAAINEDNHPIPGNLSGLSNTDQWESSPAPVKSFPGNTLGLYDLEGNVMEWVSDWYSKEYYHLSPKNNPEGPDKRSSRSVRGAGWVSTKDKVYASNRYSSSPKGKNAVVGFRVAMPRIKKN